MITTTLLVQKRQATFIEITSLECALNEANHSDFDLDHDEMMDMVVRIDGLYRLLEWHDDELFLRGQDINSLEYRR